MSAKMSVSAPWNASFSKLPLHMQLLINRPNSLPVAALLTGEALEVVDVVLGSHDHLERRDHLRTRRTVAGRAEQPIDTAVT